MPSRWNRSLNGAPWVPNANTWLYSVSPAASAGGPRERDGGRNPDDERVGDVAVDDSQPRVPERRQQRRAGQRPRDAGGEGEQRVPDDHRRT
jgi:hypothetical protein